MIEIKTIHDAAEVLRHPENFYSHHKADALEIAKKLLLEVDGCGRLVDADRLLREHHIDLSDVAPTVIPATERSNDANSN